MLYKILNIVFLYDIVFMIGYFYLVVVIYKLLEYMGNFC